MAHVHRISSFSGSQLARGTQQHRGICRIFATLSGHGKVWLQSLPFSRLADRIIQAAPSAGGSAQGEGSVLGGIGRLLDGN